MTAVTVSPPAKPAARRVILVSVGAAILTMVLKFGAYLLTGSVSLLSDAAESSVNLIAALVAFVALTIAAKPAAFSYRYGYEKAEYFSSGVEGALILVAAITIIYTALKRFLNPAPLESLGIGLVISLVASAINFGVARLMFRKGEEYDSITLEADGHHLMTDVWTSVGVVAGLVVMLLVPAWTWLDPLIAMLLGINIIRTGVSLLKRSAAGLMDITLPPEEMDQIEEVLRGKEGQDVVYHKLRTRKSASRRYVEFHLLMPQAITVKAAHDRCTAIETELRRRLPKTRVMIHVEPKETGGV
ncbi:MAG: cation diffusion facilitator family transporter [Nitrososphaerales archaeon]